MGLYDCLQEAVRGKEISASEAENLFSRYDDLRRAKGGGPQADAEAKAMLSEQLKTEAAAEKRRALIDTLKTAQTNRDLDTHVGADGQPDMVDAVLSKFEHFGTAKFSSIEGQSRAIAGQALSRFAGGVEAFKRHRLLGDNLNLPGGKRLNFRKNQVQLNNLGREAYGTSTNDQTARSLFKQWSDSAEWLRQQFNAAGGAIAKIEGGWLPQSHDRLALIKAGREAWKQKIGPLLDWDRMKHPKTGASILKNEIDGLLDEVFDTITMRGWNHREATRQLTGKGALAKQYAEQRFFHFRNWEAHSEYARDFGEGDLFTAMTNHISSMSNDIAMLRVMGTNPAAMLNFYKGKIEKHYAGQGLKGDSKIKKAHHRLDNLYDTATGQAGMPVSNGMATGLAGARNLITASVLGSANFTALSDLGFQAMARKVMGMPQVKAFGSYLKYMQTKGEKEAVRAGLILDSALHAMHAQSRYLGVLEGSGITNYLADRVITLSGLSPFTQAGRHAFGMDMMGHLADHAGKGWQELPKPMRDLLNQWGFNSDQWNIIRGSKLHVPEKNSAPLLRPNDISDPDLALKWGEMVMMQTDFAVPTTSHRARAALGVGKRGTPLGEVQQSFMQFMNFSFAFLFLQKSQLDKLGGIKGFSGATYAGQLLIMTSLYAALGLQLGEIAKGRDPMNMSTGKFWGAAALKGGGIGLYGDFLFSGLNRYGKGLPNTLTGPLVQRGDDLINLTLGNAMEALQGKDTHMGKEAVRFLKSNTPGSSLWWLRAAGERNFFDQLSYLVDPKAQQGFDRHMRSRQRDYGQNYFWKPGQRLPSRGPDFSKMFGG